MKHFKFAFIAAVASTVSSSVFANEDSLLHVEVNNTNDNILDADLVKQLLEKIGDSSAPEFEVQPNYDYDSLLGFCFDRCFLQTGNHVEVDVSIELEKVISNSFPPLKGLKMCLLECFSPPAQGTPAPTPPQTYRTRRAVADIGSVRNLLERTVPDYPDKDIPPTSALNVITSLGANPDATFAYQHNVITKQSCDSLITFTESSFVGDANRDLPSGNLDFSDLPEGESAWYPDNGDKSVYNKKIIPKELISIIGPKETLKILDFFHESLGENVFVDSMHIARQNSAKTEQSYVPWHVDEYATLEIVLNTGGDILHLSSKGATKTDSRPGTATAHGTDIVHGVTSSIGSPKYMLILKYHSDRPSETALLSRDIVHSF